MVEKPISAHKADAERLISVADKHQDLVFGGMFQMRVEHSLHPTPRLGSKWVN